MAPERLGFFNLVTTIGKWSVAWVIFLFWSLCILVCAPFVSAKKLFPFSQRMIRLLMLAIGVRVFAHGTEHLDPDKGYVYMVNHSSFLDPFVLGARIPQFLVGVEKAENFKIPIYGWIIRWWGHVAIVREDREKALAAIESAKKTVLNGTSIAIAPEGTRSRDGRVAPFKKGGFHLAKGAHAQIVPVSIEGVHDVNPDRKFRLRTGVVHVTFHPPIDAEAPELDELIETVRAQILSASTLQSQLEGTHG